MSWTAVSGGTAQGLASTAALKPLFDSHYKKLVPGHGPTVDDEQTGRNYFKKMYDYLEDFHDHLQAGDRLGLARALGGDVEIEASSVAACSGLC